MINVMIKIIQLITHKLNIIMKIMVMTTIIIMIIIIILIIIQRMIGEGQAAAGVADDLRQLRGAVLFVSNYIICY